MLNKPELKLRWLHVLLPLLIVWLPGCASKLPDSPARSVKPPAIPSLPAEARQPIVPSICLPSCTQALTIERGNWLQKLTGEESPVSPASAPTTR